MSKDEISFKNRDRFIQMGIAISSLRKMRGMSQEQLAEKASISRSHLARLKRRIWSARSPWKRSSTLPTRLM